jgi:hypothetical protein
MALNSVASDLADTARVERAALDLLRGCSGIFDSDFDIVSANRSVNASRSLCERRSLSERLHPPVARLEHIVRCIAARGDQGIGEIDGVMSDRIAGIFTFEPWED